MIFTERFRRNHVLAAAGVLRGKRNVADMPAPDSEDGNFDFAVAVAVAFSRRERRDLSRLRERVVRGRREKTSKGLEQSRQ
ncbi:hypothetical protein TorRG33x02_187530 [Trema orientale]|uniref:Uncharacterized protein n=1 Tax=Trema orientale TaxID=63057 RepID=A0A2P5EJ12_TREOI|nr:hypothetical protein TorRG33x02_187530 [Trema orientale]